jgi:pyruvate dehydrogenase E2 component (dihydrolipoamide acetyltransferase)
MATEVKLPELGENIESAKVLSILVKEGDAVAAEQGLIEVETDKASIEVPSPVAGKVASIMVKEGDEIEVGQAIAAVEAGEGPAEQQEKKLEQEKEKEEEKKEAAAEQPSDAPAEPEAETPPGKPATPAPAEQPSAEPARPAEEAPDDGGARRSADVHAAPSVRRIAREMGVDITQVHGSGPQGRVRPADLRGDGRAPGPAQAPALPDFTQWGEVEVKPLTGIRRATATHMANAWSQVPHVTQHDRADITALESARQQFQKRADAAGAKLTVTAIAIKALAAALRAHPQFNVSLDVASEQVIYKQYVHIGVAVDTPGGLLVPVIRDADRKGVLKIAVELGDLSSRARDRKLGLDEMRGASCTLTNLGGLGTTYFTPIVNWPEVAIIGTGRARHEPVWTGAAFEPRLIMPLSISYDHRAVDGADAARFLRWLAEALEAPLLMLL